MFLRKEMKGRVDPESSEISYLAIPFLGPQSDPVLVLYAACFELNFFADNDRIKKVVSMCDGFCKLFDYLQVDNFPNLRNFSLLSRQGGQGKSARLHKHTRTSRRYRSSSIQERYVVQL
jgi:hypothetical protein